MATGKDLGALIGQLGADTKQWDRAMTGARSDLGRLQAAGMAASQKISQSFDRMGQNLQNIGRTMTVAVTLPIAAAGTMAVKKAADFERLRVQMDALTGSADAGAKAFEDLVQFSARTPFQLQDLARVQNTLMGFGQSADAAFDSLQMLADASAIAGADLQGVAIAFGQASAEGKLMTRDIRQFINQGVPAVKLLSETMGVAQSQVFNLAEQGKISFDILIQAFKDATGAGGIYEDGVEKLATTIYGLFSTLKDRVSIALGTIGDAIVDTFSLDEVIPRLGNGIQRIADNFAQLHDETKKQLIRTAGLLAAGGPLLVALGGAAKAISAFVKFASSRFFLLTGAVILVGTTVQWLWDNFGTAVDGITLDIDQMKNAATTLFGVVGTAASWVGEQIINLAKTAYTWLGTAANSVMDFGEDSESGFTSFGESMDNAYENAKSFVNQMGALAADASGLQDFLNLLNSLTAPTGGEGNAKNPIGKKGLPAMEIPEIDLSKYKASLDTALSLWDKFKIGFEEIGQEFKSFLAQEIQGAVLSFSEALGRSLSGAVDNFATTFEKITMIVLDFAKSLARLAAGIGGVMLFIPGMQGAGAGLLAAAATLNAIVAGFQAGINKRIENREQRATSVNDAFISKDGKLIKLNPDDDILAMKGMSKMGAMGPGASTQINNRGIEEAIVRGMERATVRISSNYVDEKLKEFQRFQERIGN